MIDSINGRKKEERNDIVLFSFVRVDELLLGLVGPSEDSCHCNYTNREIILEEEKK